MTVQGGQFLNARLVQIALEQDLDIIRRTTTINVNAGVPSYNLPSNYLRAREVFYNINGVVYELTSRSLAEYDSLYNGPGMQDYPYLYATDISQTPPLIYLYPQPSIAFTLTVRYMDNNVEITTPESSNTVPWFQDQLLLLKMVVEDLMLLADDSRHELVMNQNDEFFRRYLRMANDKEDRALTVQKDPKSFRSVRSVKPTKIQGD